MTFVIGMPVFLVELTLGQFSAIGPLKIFKYLSPAFKGLGYAIIIASTFVCIYYNVIISWTIFYFFDSARSVVNWQFCDHSFNTEACFREADYSACKMQNSSHVFFNRTCYNSTYAISNNITEIPAANRISPAQEYFNFYVLNISSGIEDIGSIEWKIALCLLVSWIVVVISLIKGIKSSGKVVYFTATFPYVILFILFIRGVTLEGATEGLKFYLIPDFSKLSDIKVWEAAAIQVFYSFSIGGGGMLTYASYNRFKNNLIKDVLIIGIADMLTSIFSGLVVFSMLGYTANQLQKNVSDVVKSDNGLAFIAYPEGISKMPGSVFWALLFFFMLFLLGIDSQVWEAAAIQVFYSFSIGGGGMLTYASYNRFKNNLIKDVLIIGIADMLTSIFSGLVVFSMLGYTANQLQKNVSDVVKSDNGLAFIAYPEGISKMPGSVFWALLFFFMLFLLGIDSQFSMVESLITAVFDQFPKTRDKKPLVVISIGIILFFLGLPLTTRGGIYILEIMDAYAAGWPYLFIGLVECIIVGYIYGINNFLSDIKHMVDWVPNWWIKSHLTVTLVTISPTLIALILLLSWIEYKPLELGNYVFPTWANAIGWMMAIIPIACIPIGIFHEIFIKHRKRPFSERAKKWIRPTSEWFDNSHRNGVLKDNSLYSSEGQLSVIATKS
ncbi:sodium- and chloride-dependent glycine transporter 1-like [Centruroides sculpturatus]|uniref:sodium- and chloride-dependent glycine transporter 1-like n=1 Tax=Centruroides sculpturatus TaxID=218467 RepID=UPI000C6E8809|nr:sodium- and chloride-dependent glycine transporter 1-like [Centruroides sculpturatus]